MSAKVIKELHQILLWPLRLNSGSSPESFPEEIHKCLIAHDWEERDLVRCDGFNDRLAYSEFVYFHPFAQRFLYGGDEEQTKQIKLYSRSEESDCFKSARVFLNKERYQDCKEENPVDVTFDHIHLYHFCKMDIFILVIELTIQNELSIQMAEDFLDQFRRVYPPYWQNGKAGHCPCVVELYDGSDSDRPVCALDYGEQKKFMDFLKKNRQAAVAGHWQKFMCPLSLTSPPDSKSKGESEIIYCRHIVDERIPYMAHIAIENPGWLSRGDMIRLSLADEGGPSHTLPYATEFLSDFETKYCYDRFWEVNQCPGEWKNTRYIITDCSFSAIGAWQPPGKNGFQTSIFCNPDHGILAHFRHHYFQMMLVAQFYQATLLSLSDQLAESVTELQQQEPKKREIIHKEARVLQHKLLVFSHSCWFMELSNQMQGKELFAMMLRQQKTYQLYEKVNNASNELYEYLETEFQSKETELTTRLTVVATFGLVASIVTGYFGMELLFATDGDQLIFKHQWIHIGLVVLVVMLLTLISFVWSNTISKLLEKLRNKLWIGLVALAVMLLAFASFVWLNTISK